jgi:integrase
MPSLKKINVTRYLDADRRQVPKGTPGARKVRQRSRKWYAVWREARVVAGVKVRKQVCKPLSADKKAAHTMLAEIIRRQEREKAGLLDPREERLRVQLSRPVGEHVEDYLRSLRESGVSEAHHRERSRLLRKVVAALKAKSLADLTTDKLNAFVADLRKAPTKNNADPGPASARTKATYRNAAVYFFNWLAKDGRVSHNWLASATVPRGRKVRCRRALTAQELQRVLDAARSRPLNEKEKINRGPDKGIPGARLKDAYRERLILLGRGRALVYLTAVYTGLRRKEIAALRVSHLRLDARPLPHLCLPGEETKNGEDAKLLLIPAFAEELRRWVEDTRRGPNDILFPVWGKMVRVFRKDLKAAGVPYRDEQGRCADFHSLRMTADTVLGLAGVPPRVRQLFMRHKGIRLTLETYDDQSHYELQSAVQALEATNLR